MSDIKKIPLETNTLYKLKKLADHNDRSLNEEFVSALSEYDTKIDSEILEQVEIIPKKAKAFLLLPEELYNMIEERASDDSAGVSDEIDIFLQEYLFNSGYEDTSVPDYEEEEGYESESSSLSDEQDYQDDEDEDDSEYYEKSEYYDEYEELSSEEEGYEEDYYDEFGENEE